jgi:hypothetical protein
MSFKAIPVFKKHGIDVTKIKKSYDPDSGTTEITVTIDAKTAKKIGSELEKLDTVGERYGGYIQESNERVVKESTKNVLNENEMAMSTLILIPALAGVLGLGIGNLLGQAYYEDKSLVQQVKDWWKSKKDNKAMAKIADRLKDDPEVQSFIKSPNKRGWQKMLASKLTPDEQKYVRSIYRTRFKSGQE